MSNYDPTGWNFDDDDPTLQARFEAYHDDNPHVYAKLEELAQMVHERGRQHIGIALLYEQLRWLSLFSTTGDEYKLNNNYKSRYSRKLMDEHPEYEGLFATRRLTA